SAFVLRIYRRGYSCAQGQQYRKGSKETGRTGRTGYRAGMFHCLLFHGNFVFNGYSQRYHFFLCNNKQVVHTAMSSLLIVNVLFLPDLFRHFGIAQKTDFFPESLVQGGKIIVPCLFR
ncbi:MAG: hypothetical protein D3920_11695, partial [Candidatus Electrothrix sp. AW2]|nr:hypothetical protein [Candidatus Electrothrix gigas]